jgi:hypothetical protein
MIKYCEQKITETQFLAELKKLQPDLQSYGNSDFIKEQLTRILSPLTGEQYTIDSTYSVPI